MVTPEKTAANAANAQHSTGPTSPEGKARSSLNALKHGLTAVKPVIPPDTQEEYNALQASLRPECDPQGALEELAFDQLVFAAWKQRIIRHYEADLLDQGVEAMLDESIPRTLDRLQRYGSAADRAYSRALKELRALQTERTLRGTIPDEIAALIPTLASLPAVTKQQAANGRAAAQALKQELDAIMSVPEPHPGLVDQLSAELDELDKEEEVA
jgi:hypothetical protein